jgi:hypothetical protein
LAAENGEPRRSHGVTAAWNTPGSRFAFSAEMTSGMARPVVVAKAPPARIRWAPRRRTTLAQAASAADSARLRDEVAANRITEQHDGLGVACSRPHELERRSIRQPGTRLNLPPPRRPTGGVRSALPTLI